MRRKRKAFDAWKQMKPPALRRLALAAFLMFSILGPLAILMESELGVHSWRFVIVQTIASGSYAGCIVLFSRKRWWITLVIVMFWSGVLVVNGGGLSFVFGDDGFRVHLQGSSPDQVRGKSNLATTLSPDQQDALYSQRGILGAMAIVLLASGYITFIRVVRKEIQQRARLETEVSIAHDIQQSLLPHSVFQSSWYSIAGTTIPATEVGGDHFDVIQVSDECVIAAVADVTGHGVGAGILSAMTKSALHSQLEHDAVPRNVLANLNKTIFELTDEKHFVTFALLAAHRSSGVLRLATAGHPPMLYKRTGSQRIEQIRTINLGLGLQREAQFTDVEFPFVSGDCVLLYTDGLVEAANGIEEQFGMVRLEQSFLSANGSPKEICDTILRALRDFTKNEAFQDDVTLACVNLGKPSEDMVRPSSSWRQSSKG